MESEANLKYGLNIEDIDKIHSVFRAHPEIDKAIIYGSRAMGREKPSSDIDLAFVGDDLTLSTLNILDVELDDLLLPYTFDLSIYEKISNADVCEHIKRVGQIFFEK